MATLEKDGLISTKDANGDLTIVYPITRVSAISDLSEATTSSEGLMSTSDKSKLDGIATGATNVTSSTVSGWGFTKNSGTYSKPSGGIPKTDLASAVQTSLGKADTALQSHQDISGKVDKTSAGVSVAINLLTEGTSTPQDSDYYVSQYVGGGTTTTTYHRRPMSSLWSYIKSKVEALGYTKNTGTVTSVSVKMNGSSKGTVTTSGTIDLGTVLTSHQDISGKQDKSTAVTHTASTAVGSATQPVYIDSNGVATATTYSLGKSVPSDAKFTDTTYSAATSSANGLMSSTDKAKLDSGYIVKKDTTGFYIETQN